MKTNPNPLWTSLLSPPCNGNYDIGPLKSAIFTTYETPDSAFLVEDFLPEILGLDRRLTDDSNEYFFAELNDKLKRSNIAIISSFGKEIANDYKRLLSPIKYYSTGLNEKAVQHAKLWLLHRESVEQNKSETLEIHVSSANLTKSAFEDQIQSAWRVIVPLSNESTNTNLKSWGVLPKFLSELGKSCGNRELADDFHKLLKNAKAPNDVTFLASVPGTHKSNSDWGREGLRKLKSKGRGSTKIRVFVPYVGEWDNETLTEWTRKIGCDPHDLSLMWIDKSHQWALNNNWKMPETTFENLTSSKVKFYKLLPIKDNEDFCIHEEQQKDDKRWSHSKIYELHKGNSRKIILTSANFSLSAWGKSVQNGIHINNFEFGVALSKKSVWSLDDFLESTLTKDEAYLSDDGQKEDSENGLVWAYAVWDGKTITIKARTATHNKHPIEMVIVNVGKIEFNKIEKWDKINNLWEWSTDWNPKKQQEKNGIPNFVSIKCNSRSWKRPVNDERQDDEKDSDPIPEVNSERSQELKDAILLERYGGPFVDDIKVDFEDVVDKEKKSQNQQNTGKSNVKSDYSLPWMVQAREWHKIIDNWKTKYEQPSSIIKKDGGKLIDYFNRKKVKEPYPGISVAAKLMAEEIKMRIE